MAEDIRASELKEPIDVAEYLFRRLKEVGVESIHGVPGDYNLAALDYIPKTGLRWVGNVNELNAGYAADGYARIKGISALITTFGVGELSALNAISGAFSELVPVVHIVGYPSTASQAEGAILHHTLGNGDYTVFKSISTHVSVAVAMLNDPAEVCALIDDAIQKCWLESRPVYLALPTDMVTRKVEGARLQKKIPLEYKANDEEKEDYVVGVVLKSLTDAKNPVILVDACASRHRALGETKALIQKSNIPTFVTPMGKGTIDETMPNYGGVYAGDASNPGVKERVESSDLILSIGAIKSDFNTAGFSYRISQLKTIDFHSTYVRVRYSEYPGVRMNGVLKKVTEQLPQITVAPGPEPSNELPQKEQESEDTTITHAWLWPHVGNWLRDGDVVITETGTSNFGIWQTRFPANVKAISQVLWGSIGYATGATQGAALAAKEMGIPRTILFTGEGSFQLTAQEVSTMLRNDLAPIIFVIVNKGFTIERLIHGMDAEYNDIQDWRYRLIPEVFGAREGQAQTYLVKTRKDVESLFANPEFSTPDSKQLRFVEVQMPRDDAPIELKLTAAAAAKRNE